MCAQSCLTLSDPMDYNPPGSSVHGIFQERIMEWVAISYFRSPENQGIINIFPACLFGPGVSQKSFSPGHHWFPLQWNSLLSTRGCSGSLRASFVALPPSLLSLVTAPNGGHVVWPLSHLVPMFLTPALNPSLFLSRPHLSLKTFQGKPVSLHPQCLLSVFPPPPAWLFSSHSSLVLLLSECCLFCHTLSWVRTWDHPSPCSLVLVQSSVLPPLL